MLAFLSFPKTTFAIEGADGPLARMLKADSANTHKINISVRRPFFRFFADSKVSWSANYVSLFLIIALFGIQ